MNITDKIEYQRHLRTGNLVKKLYLLKCKGNKLTPEKFDSLCRLTWLHGDKKSALINIWDGREDKIPIKFLDLVENNNVGIVNYRNTYRNSTFDWIQTNFKQIRLLVDRVFKMNSDDVAMGIAIAIEQLPHISSPSKKNKLNPTSLLTPIFACMDQRNRFPLINGNENIEELLRKIGLTESSLPEKVEGLIRLIGSYGITDAFMLDVLSYNLSKKTFYSKKGKSRDKIKAN